MLDNSQGSDNSTIIDDLLGKDDLSEAQRGLIDEIRNNFDSQLVKIDTCILYEVTSFKDKSDMGKLLFWDQYEDYFSLNTLKKEGKIDQAVNFIAGKMSLGMTQLSLGIDHLAEDSPAVQVSLNDENSPPDPRSTA